MLIREIIEQAKKIISSRVEAEILLAHVLKKTREFLIAHSEARVSNATYKKFIDFCKKRKKGIPLVYITHNKEFYGLDFYVDSRVFIPRPETELLVEEVLRLAEGISNPRILDIGTGSGCIAISLAVHILNARIIASDISYDALTIAKKNAKLHCVANKIKFVKSELLERIPYRDDRVFDILIANLPYIGFSENHLVSREVLDFEPREALFSGRTGLELFERLFAQIVEKKAFPKRLVLEIGFLQKYSIDIIIKKYFGEVEVSWNNDLAGIPRMVTIQFLC